MSGLCTTLLPRVEMIVLGYGANPAEGEGDMKSQVCHLSAIVAEYRVNGGYVYVTLATCYYLYYCLSSYFLFADYYLLLSIMIPKDVLLC